MNNNVLIIHKFLYVRNISTTTYDIEQYVSIVNLSLL